MILKEKNIMLPKIAFQNLGTTKLHLGSQDPGSRKFSCPGQDDSLFVCLSSTDIQTDRQTDRKTERLFSLVVQNVNRMSKGQSDRQEDIQCARQTDRVTERQNDSMAE